MEVLNTGLFTQVCANVYVIDNAFSVCEKLNVVQSHCEVLP